VEEETVSFVLNNTEEGVGMCAQAKFKGGDIWYAGIVQDLHVDGTYHILYEDGDEEASVKRDMIEPVEVFSVDFPLFFLKFRVFFYIFCTEPTYVQSLRLASFEASRAVQCTCKWVISALSACAHTLRLAVQDGEDKSA
jgi:hypothetical protein